MMWQYCCALGLLSGGLAQSVYPLLSPSGNLKLAFWLDGTGRPTYSLAFASNDSLIIAPSGMGLQLFDHSDPANPHQLDSFYDGFDYLPAGDGLLVEYPPDVDEVWEPVWGEESEIRDNHKEMIVRLVQTLAESTTTAQPGATTPAPTLKTRELDIRFRMFDEGVGFRYEVPYQDNLIYYDVSEEQTQFAMTADHSAWWITGDYDTEEYNYMFTKLSEIRAKYHGSYEANPSQYPFEGGVQTALQIVTEDGLYIHIHEAALLNYSAMSLEIHDEDPKNLYFQSHLTPDAVGVKAHLQAPNTSPWRTIIASYDVRDVLRSRITYNLNEPPTGDFSWVKPVKFMGVWWEMITGHRRWDYTYDVPSIQLGVTDYSKCTPHGRHGAENQNVKNYIDFASHHGFDALLVEGWDEGWEDWFDHGKDYVFDFQTAYPDFNVDELMQYAKDKNLQLIMHHETSGSTRNYERHVDRAYQFMVDKGYKSVKSGYVGNILPIGQHHYSQDLVNHFNWVVKKAVDYKLCVDAHEAVRPTGLARTWPNMIANEAARGQEYQAMGGSPPSHVTILPFTRQIGGPMDYTPGIFRHDLYNWVDGHDRNDTKWRVQSTITQQLSLYVTMYSPLQMAADTYQNYEPHVNGAFQFIKDVPVDWHKSVYLEGKPGSYVTTARLDKAGKANWFIGSTHGGIQGGRYSEFTFDFLDADTCYKATIYYDAVDTHYWTNPHKYLITQQFVQKNDQFRQWCAPGGGYAMKLEKLSDFTGCDTTTSTSSILMTRRPTTTTTRKESGSGASSTLGVSLLALAIARFYFA